MTLSKRNLVWLFTAGTFFAFFLFGFADNLKGPTLPALLRDLGFSYSQGGTLLMAVYVGFLVATLFTGVLADVAGQKTVLMVAGACLLVGMGVYSLLRSFWLLTGTMVVLGLGLGALEVGGNTFRSFFPPPLRLFRICSGRTWVRRWDCSLPLAAWAGC